MRDILYAPRQEKIILIQISKLLIQHVFTRTSPVVSCSGVVSRLGESWV